MMRSAKWTNLDNHPDYGNSFDTDDNSFSFLPLRPLLSLSAPSLLVLLTSSLLLLVCSNSLLHYLLTGQRRPAKPTSALQTVRTGQLTPSKQLSFPQKTLLPYHTYLDDDVQRLITKWATCSAHDVTRGTLKLKSPVMTRTSSLPNMRAMATLRSTQCTPICQESTIMVTASTNEYILTASQAGVSSTLGTFSA